MFMLLVLNGVSIVGRERYVSKYTATKDTVTIPDPNLDEVIDRLHWRGIGVKAVEVKAVEPFYVSSDPTIRGDDFLGFELNRDLDPRVRQSIAKEIELLGFRPWFDTSRNREQLYLH